jgi:outer membrane protein OmpA-like peptidoglycan-associated protein/outer membrane protein W
MKSRITKTVALAALMASGATVAQATEGWYGRADVGYSTDGNVDFGDGESYDLENDWTTHLGLGYAFQNNFRLEGELGHRFNNFGEDVGLDDGDVRVWSGMLNLFYDFNRGGRIEPYIGAGIGAARVEGVATEHPILYVDDQDTVLAYQAIVGLAIGITERLDLDVGYRYFVAEGGEFDGQADIGNGLEAITVDGDYEQQAVTVGLRWQFAGAEAPPPPPPPVQPPPPPPPPPPVTACPTSEFVVYFEWDRSNLNQAALETIDAAVNRARQCNVSGVVVVGHTDTSGSTAYNQGLSERRASVVRDALVARGIATGSIQAQARGETDLARATNDGVREPLNRRSAVTIRFR